MTPRSTIPTMRLSFIASLVILVPMLSANGQQQRTPSQNQVTAWADHKVWANGLTINLHHSVNKDSFYVACHRHQNDWDAAFAFLKNANLAELQPGKYPIIGDQVFAIVTDGPPHPKDSVKWESHKHYVDLHYVILGKETIGVADTAKAAIINPYTPDVINYTAQGAYYTAAPGELFLFFSNDAHRPSIKIDGCDRVKKIVIKIITGY